MSKNWIAGAIKHPGALHRELGVPQGQKIPQSTLSRAAGAGGELGRRARFAQELEGFPHRATGGPVQRGKPYVVGEQGPEVFRPKQKGRIDPNAVRGALMAKLRGGGAC
jgi:hypothetical protein